VSDRPQAGALLAALRHDLAGIRAQLDQLSEDELTTFGGALHDAVTELRLTLADRGCDLPTLPVRDAWGDGSARAGDRRCPAPNCGRRIESRRADYCSGRCRMRAFRLRRLLNTSQDVVEAVTPNGRRPADHCVYECTTCNERYLGERRCPECGLFNRNLGLGAPCPECDHPIALSDLLTALSVPPVDGRRS
jgi:hypothetical protein